MLGIRRIDHICMAVPKLDDRIPMLTELFGMKVVARFDNPTAGYNGVALDVPGGGAQWEVLEPSDESSFIQKFLDDRGPGLHHVTFQVESIAEATKALEQFGLQPFGAREYETYKEIFLHPAETGGVLFQLYEGDWD